MTSANYPIHCRCGRLQGTLARAAPTLRASCYCLDCQTYAHALAAPEQTLDPQGGTEVVATLQQHITFTAGADSLTCLSLSPNGLLRWYASCCNTPIANITRNPKLSYVGIVHTCLGTASARTAAFGPPRSPVNTKHAKGKVKTSALNLFGSMLGIMASVLRARVTGAWRRSPFFNPAGYEPVAAPRILTREEREQAKLAAINWRA